MPASLKLIFKTTQISVLFASALGWTCSLVSDGHNWSHPANPTQICLQPQTRSSQQTHCGKHDAALMQHKSSGNAFVQGFTSLSPPLGLKRASQPSLLVNPPPRPQTQRDLLSTHSFGLGFVGSGGPSFPGDGDSLPGEGGGGESGAIRVGLFSSVIGSNFGRGGSGGGGGGVLSVGGVFGSVGWSVVTDPLSLSAHPTSESICTGGSDDTLGQISSSLTWNISATGWGGILGGSSSRLISVGVGGGGNAATSSIPELSPDRPLLDESSAANRNKHKKVGKCWTLNI